MMQTFLQVHSRTLYTLVFLLFGLAACQQSDPKPASVNTDTFGRVGDSVRFSGLDWTVKIYEDVMHGPGPNYFSGDERDVFLDANGYLHMRIAQHQGKWMSSEVVADQHTGYGTYRFTVEGMLDAIPDNIVLGLFTWDNTTFQDQANSEVDIEFSKWGNVNADRTLQYGVQPINFGPYYPERDFVPQYEPGTMNGVSVHEFTWTDKLITWRSYAGEQVDPARLIGEWSFDQSNPGRVKNEGGRSSKPIVIPAPGNETSARINFWILTGIAPGPKDNARHEVIIRKFEYLPL